MRELEIARKHLRERAQQAVGVYRGRALITKAAVDNAQADLDIEKLPEAFFEDDAIQTAGGAFYFMIDFSAIDGPDPIG